LLAAKTVSKNYNDSDASTSARTKLTFVLTTLVNEWVAANPDKLCAANVSDLERKPDNAEKDFREKRAAYRDAEAKMNAVRDELTRAKGGKA